MEPPLERPMVLYLVQNLQWSDLDIPVPHVIAMILKGDASLFGHIGPIRIVFRKLGILNQLIPCRSPEMVFQNGRTILLVNNCTLVTDDLCAVPFSGRFGVLGFCRDQVIQ